MKTAIENIETLVRENCPNGTIIGSIKSKRGAIIGDVEKVSGGYYIHRGKNRANTGETFTLNQALWMASQMELFEAPIYADWLMMMRVMKSTGVK